MKPISIELMIQYANEETSNSPLEIINTYIKLAMSPEKYHKAKNILLLVKNFNCNIDWNPILFRSVQHKYYCPRFCIYDFV